MWLFDKVFARVPVLKRQYREATAENIWDTALGEVDTTVSTDFPVLSQRFHQYRQLQASLGRRCDRAITLPALAAIHERCDASAKRKCGIAVGSEAVVHHNHNHHNTAPFYTCSMKRSEKLVFTQLLDTSFPAVSSVHSHTDTVRDHEMFGHGLVDGVTCSDTTPLQSLEST